MPNSSQFLEDKSGDNSSRKKRRHKGDGSGCIYWRTVTKKGKTYHEAYYQYELWSEGERLLKSTKYIPKRLLKGVQALEAANAPVIDVLLVLGVGKRLLESSTCPACQQPLSSLENGCVVCGWGSSDSISPKKEVEEFFRGNSQESCQSISPKKKGRGENKIPASGSLVPVVQTRRDKDGRVVEYPKVEGDRVHRSAAFDYPHQFVWLYCWAIEDNDGCWQNHSKSVPRHRIWFVRSAIALRHATRTLPTNQAGISLRINLLLVSV
jgi:hypothetical protein